MSATDAELPAFASVCLKTGSVDDPAASARTCELTADLASAAGELLLVGDSAALADLLRDSGATRQSDRFEEAVVLSSRAMYAVRRSGHEATRAAVAVGSAGGKLGLLLSGLREQLARSGGA